MNFSVFVDDVESGMTHIIRGKDHMDNAKKQEMLYPLFNKPVPETMFIGRINFIGLDISKTETKKRIERGEFSGWDDIRLPFLVALKRRGYQPEAFVKYTLGMGVSQTDKTVTGEDFFKLIDSHNREIIEPTSNRYFFIPEPKEIIIKNAPEKEVSIELHPDYPKRGHRKFETKTQFYIADNDFKQIHLGKLYRLMDCLNFIKTESGFEFNSEGYEEFKEKGGMIMHWLPVKYDLTNVEVLMPDNTILKGFGENGLTRLNEGAIVQFERFGFVKLDKKANGKLKFWFTHK